jgi:CTP:molybdopterin cytidylyltransferase MocA
MQRITEMVEIAIGDEPTITKTQLKAILSVIKDTETKILVKVHKDGKNTILSNETSHNAIKRLFP